ncbi:MAG: PrsW family glutamic-type intramembrane protease [Nannocystaceae bacterium]
MEDTVLALSTVMPSLLLLWYFHSRDVYPEPARVVWTTFALGVLIAGPVLLFALPMGAFAEQLSDPFAAGAYEAFVLAALPEETFKLAVLVWYARRHSAFDEPMDGLVYGVAASLGFATLENILYVAQGGLGVAVLRAVTSIPGHATFGAIMGYYVGQAHFSRGRGRALLFKAWLIPVLLHGLYDTPLLAAGGASAAGYATAASALLAVVPVILAISVISALKMSRGLRATQLAAGPLPERGVVPTPANPPRPAGAGLWWIAVLGGGLVASAGGLVTIAVALAWAQGELGDFGAGMVIATIAAFGALPLLGGLALFRLGTRRLNRGGPID